MMESIINTYLEDIKRLQQSQLELMTEINKNTKALITLIKDNPQIEDKDNIRKALIIEEN